MKIEYYSTCTSEGIHIDDEDFSEISLQAQKDIVYKVIDKIFEENKEFRVDELHDLLYNIEPITSDFADEPCEQCGDYYEEATWEI